MKKNINWDVINSALTALDIKRNEGPIHKEIQELVSLYGYESLDVMIDLSKTFPNTIGVLVVQKNMENNDGVYAIAISHDLTVGVMVIVPNTISKAPMITKTIGDIKLAIDNVNLPILSTFDKTEIAGHILHDLVIEPLMDSLRIPEALRPQFITMYLPRFLANVARQYIGDESLREEHIDSEPAMVKEMLLHPEKFKQIDKDNTITTKGESSEC